MTYQPIPAGSSGGTSLTGVKVVTAQAEAGLDAETNLGALTTGLLKHTVAAGISTPATAVAGTDYARPIGPHQTYRELGLGLLGITLASAHEMFENFMAMPGATAAPANWTGVSSSGSSTASVQLAGNAAISRISTGATAASGRDQATQTYMGHQGTGKWYYAARFRINASPDAQAKLLQTVTTAGGNTVGVGFHGPVDATNFIAYRDGSFAAGTSIGTLGAADTSFHTFEMWCIGDAVLKARVDAGSIISGTQTAAAADMYAYHTVRNGTTAADRQMDRRWVYWLVEVA